MFASVVKTTQPIILKPYNDDIAAASTDEMMSYNETLKIVNVRNSRFTNKGTIVVEVSHEKDRKNAMLDPKKV